MTTEEVRQQLNVLGSERHQRFVYYIQQECHVSGLAEDCVQHAYMEALRRAQRIREPSKLDS